MEEKTQFFQSQEQAYSVEELVLTVFDGEKEPVKYELGELRHRGKRITFGRNKANDIQIQSSFVSNFHGYLAIEKGKYVLYDDNSTNGIFLDGKKVTKHIIKDGDMLRIDDVTNPTVKGVSMLFTVAQSQAGWLSCSLDGKEQITIGRNPSCDICLDHVSVSSIHAIIRKEEDGYYLCDHDSTNGIIVNGSVLEKKQKLKEKDLIVITNSKLVFTSNQIRYQCNKGGIRVDALDLVKTVKTKDGPLNISDHISLTIHPCEFVAIIGGSGAGKTTFMNEISGNNRATSGTVLVNEVDLYRNYEALKSLIGYVPQQDIVYDNLTLSSMLDYSAQLRMPKDTTPSERKKRVQEVIDLVELSGREDFMIRSLSGGQKKRASIAVELLSDPNLFYLDEPTSGLDPGTERNLMKSLKNMAKSGKTVILVTHNTLNLHLCDKIIFLGKGGKLCFCGSPEDTLKFFGVDDFVDIYNMVTDEPDKWSSAYARSEYCNPPKKEGTSRKASGKKRKKQSVIRQTAILSRRYLSLLLNDKQRMLLLLCQAPLLAVLLKLVSDGNVFKQYEITKSLLFALSCCAFWVGILNSIQEVCKERVILRREHLTGLKISSYISSKYVVLGMLCLIQSLLLLGVFTALVGVPEYGTAPHTFIKMLITTFLTAISATSLGLVVSSLFQNADRAMTVAPLLLMPQILFSGLAFELTGIKKKISLFVNCRWSMEGFGTIANLNDLTLKMQKDIPNLEHKAEEFYTYQLDHLVRSWVILLFFTVLCAVVSALALRNVDKQ